MTRRLSALLMPVTRSVQAMNFGRSASGRPTPTVKTQQSSRRGLRMPYLAERRRKVPNRHGCADEHKKYARVTPPIHRLNRKKTKLQHSPNPHRRAKPDHPRPHRIADKLGSYRK
jgi:hypothetical protein